METTVEPSVKQQRYLKSGLVCGLILAVLGLGNVLYGSSRLSQYERLQIEARIEDRAELKRSRPPFAELRTGKDKTSQRLRKVEANKKFYTLVVIGGKLFFAAGALLLLFCGVLFRVRALRREENRN